MSIEKKDLGGLRPTPSASPSEEQAWLEIRDTMADPLLNQAQKRAFVLSILRGHLANPPEASEA